VTTQADRRGILSCEHNHTCGDGVERVFEPRVAKLCFSIVFDPVVSVVPEESFGGILRIPPGGGGE
jgi:hypothetical protein